jgi:UDP-N-acetyl-D-mannosaminuronic acid dehydrogenase
MRVCVIGLGEIGIPTATYISKKEFTVWGYDISSEVISQSKPFSCTNNWNTIPHKKIEVYIICVWTGIHHHKPDISSVYDVAKKIKSTMNKKPLVSIESTVSIGTCRKIYEEIFNQSVDLVNVPHRYWKMNPLKYGVNQRRVIGGINKESLERGLSFYKRLDIPLHSVSTIEISEMSKIAENAYRFLSIAFAEELKMACCEKKIDFNELRSAINTKWNTHILEAREGISGHCLPKDTKYYTSIFTHSEILKTAIVVDNNYSRLFIKKTV